MEIFFLIILPTYLIIGILFNLFGLYSEMSFRKFLEENPNEAKKYAFYTDLKSLNPTNFSTQVKRIFLWPLALILTIILTKYINYRIK